MHLEVSDRAAGRVRAAAVALGLSVAGLTLASVVALAAAVPARVLGVAPVAPGPAMLVGAVVVQGAAFAAVVAAYLRYRGRGRDYLRLRRPAPPELAIAGGGLVVLLVAVSGAGAVIQALGLEAASSRIADLGRDAPGVFLVLAALSVLVIGPAEELLFRGVVQRRLREQYPPSAAIGLASLLFAVPHVASFRGGGLGVTIGVVFVLGAVLGAFYEYADNLAVPILMHGFYNAVLFLSLYVAIRQGVDPGVTPGV